MLKDRLALFEMHPNAQNAALSLLLPQACNTKATCASHGRPYCLVLSIQHWLPRVIPYLKWEVKRKTGSSFPQDSRNMDHGSSPTHLTKLLPGLLRWETFISAH